ncbi:hypothetical protein BGZ99_008503 [Dissophora globulifera]|uniref:Uncharacterized protein n=1 Tax=Dissophora globulifera TaxID=979702 RepID=A0A9P6R759_9FUNG|nr:hypothetical protein BGZ99_008503 [Dissophora globulifera]
MLHVVEDYTDAPPELATSTQLLSPSDAETLHTSRGVVLSTPSLSKDSKIRFRSSVLLYESFAQCMQEGQTQQATLFQNDFQDQVLALEQDMSQNQDLRQQIVEMQQSIVKMRTSPVDTPMQALDRVAAIHNKVQAILVQTYEVYEKPIPRLFIVLPKDSSRWDPVNISKNVFRLYFLCECGDHTKRSDQSEIPHHIHLSKHDGYDIEDPKNIFTRYGPYMLSLLQMLKYGAAIAGMVAPAMTPFMTSSKPVDGNTDVFDNNGNSIEPGLSQAIEYLQYLSDKEDISTMAANLTWDSTQKKEPEVMECADLRELEAFIKVKDSHSVLGDLLRMVTDEGHVRWVCSDHYYEAYDSAAIKDLSESVSLNRGSFESTLSRISVSLPSATSASQLYRLLERAKCVQELKIVLQWEVSTGDLKSFRDTVLKTNIASLDMKCTASNTTSDLLSRGKRSDSLWQMMMSTQMRSFVLAGYTGFFSRTSITARTIGLRVLKILEGVDWKRDGVKIIELLEKCPRLNVLHLGISDVDEAYSLIKNINYEGCNLNTLLLDGGGSKSGMKVRFERGIPISMDLVALDLSSALIKETRIIRSLYFQPSTRNPLDVDIRLLVDVLSRNPDMVELSIKCGVSNFLKWHSAVRRAVEDDSSSKLRKLQLFGNGSANRLTVRNLLDENSVELELMSPGTSYETIDPLLEAYGTRLTKLRIDHAEILRSFVNIVIDPTDLSEEMGHLKGASRISLKCLDINMSSINVNLLHDLRLILEEASTLKDLTAHIDSSWDELPTTSSVSNARDSISISHSNDSGISSADSMIDIVVEFGRRWTGIVMREDVAAAWKAALQQRGFIVPESILTVVPREKSSSTLVHRPRSLASRKVK